MSPVASGAPVLFAIIVVLPTIIRACVCCVWVLKVFWHFAFIRNKTRMVKPRIPELETCFVCCSLRTGALIISAVSMVVGVLLCGTFAVLLVYETVESVTRETAKYSFDYKFSLVSLVLGFIVCALFEVVSVFLWIGIKQYKETYVLSWAIIITAFNFIQVIVLIFAFLFSPVGYLDYIRDTLLVLETCGIFYIALVVYSFYREIRRLKNTPQSFSNEE